MVCVNCLECGREFETRQAYVNRGQGKFCSLSCSAKYSGRRRTSGVGVVCTQCKSPLRKKPHLVGKIANFFCSRGCKAAYERIKETNCLNCGQLLDRNQKRYCSFGCMHEYKYRQFIVEWKAGGSGGDGEYLSGHVRRYLFEKADSRCQKCGWSEKNPVTGLVPLTVNHKNGNPEDHREENLELICPNCHSLTPNYGGLNLGNGRRRRADKIRARKAALP